MQRFAAALLAFALACAVPLAAPAQTGAISVDGNVALSSLVALTEGHLRTMADTLELLASTKAAQAGDWMQLAPHLRERASSNVPAVMWYANPDGTYWTLDAGLQKGTLADRPYFARVRAGSTVIGDLVVSRSTGKEVAVVAVPVTSSSGAVTGVLGASIYLQPLSELIAREMGIGPNAIFWAIDGRGIIAIHSDTSNIFMEPSAMSPELKAVTQEMLTSEGGVATYTFRGRTRTVIYRRSVLTSWHFGFGVLH